MTDIEMTATLRYLDDVAAGRISEVAKPGMWPIRNALLVLREDIARFSDEGQVSQDRYQEGVVGALRLAVEIIKGINSMKAPEPPDPAKAADRAVRAYVGQLADAAESLAQSLRAIADSDIPDDYDTYAREWRN